MEDRTDTAPSAATDPRCDCGYACTGATLEDRVEDALRHAREAHGIDVSPDQVLAATRCGMGLTMAQTGPRRGADVTIRTLGGFGVVVDDEEVRLSQWGSRRARQLCKRLAAARGEPVPREQLIDLLWPDGAVRAERLGARLSVQLSAVRRILHGGVIADAASVRLDLGHVRLDVAELGDAMTQGDLCRAVALYRGDFLPEDLYEDSAGATREQARSELGVRSVSLAELVPALGRRPLTAIVAVARR